jgi:hypothetical protein
MEEDIVKEIHINLPSAEVIKSETIMSGNNLNGVNIGVNRTHFFKNDAPWFPITGEFHYSRYPSEYWKEALYRAKAGGIDTIATYVFWIHHEEIEGNFKWSGRYDVKRFITLCKEVGLNVILRIGPWDHGEVRNGGYPDWLFEKTKSPGTNDTEYFKYSRRLYQEIYQQVKDLFYKDNGPIIGIQIDNEYGLCHGLRGDEGREHMMILKKMALEIGFDVPIYTATGWGGSIVVEGAFLPLMAAYVEGSWEQHIHVVPPNINFVFTSIRDDLTVGSDLSKNEHFSSSYDIDNYPFATCELGGGMQASYQRRPIITKEDTESMAFVKLGSGAIMLGYYMYQGGTNPIGELTTLQESRATGYPNELPKLSYDYQAPLGEYGQSNPSYHALRRLHLFAKDQETILTQAASFIADDKEIRPDDPSTLRYAVRYYGNSGFLFINNYQHNLTMSPQEDLCFTVKINNDTIQFPRVDLKSGEWRLLPFNQNLNGINMICATVQPLTSLQVCNEYYYFYYGDKDHDIEYKMDSLTIKAVLYGDVCSNSNGETVIKQTFQKDNTILDPIILKNQNGDTINIVTLTKQQATQLNKVDINNNSYIIISEADTYVDDQQVQVVSIGKEEVTVLTFPALPSEQKLDKYSSNSVNGIFNLYSVRWTPVKPAIKLNKLGVLTNGHLQYALIVEKEYLAGCTDVFLEINFEGDIAELTQDGKLKADWFYTGLTWRIGLKRFEKDLCKGNWLLDISPLSKEAFIYLDKWPDMVDDKALNLVDYKIVPEYRII